MPLFLLPSCSSGRGKMTAFRSLNVCSQRRACARLKPPKQTGRRSSWRWCHGMAHVCCWLGPNWYLQRQRWTMAAFWGPNVSSTFWLLLKVRQGRRLATHSQACLIRTLRLHDLCCLCSCLHQAELGSTQVRASCRCNWTTQRGPRN